MTHFACAAPRVFRAVAVSPLGRGLLERPLEDDRPPPQQFTCQNKSLLRGGCLAPPGGNLYVFKTRSLHRRPLPNPKTKDLQSGEVTPLARGADFYAGPALSPDAAALGWIEWDHP